jgi:hypothetical protein
MRMSRGRIEVMAKSAVQRLLAQRAIAAPGIEVALTARVVEVIEREFALEDQLNLDARELMRQYQRQIESGQVDYQRMFTMIKRQLAKDRGVII